MEGSRDTIANVHVTIQDIEELRPDPGNARIHDARNIEAIYDSIREHGAMRSIVVQQDDQIIAGSGTWEAARAAGVTRAIVVETDGEALIVHKRRGMTEESARRYGFADNWSAEQARWNEAILAEWAATHPETFAAMLTDAEIAELAVRVEEVLLAVPNAEEDADGFADAPQIRANAQYRVEILLDGTLAQDLTFKAALNDFCRTRGLHWRLRPAG